MAGGEGNCSELKGGSDAKTVIPAFAGIHSLAFGLRLSPE